jgi:hypothetical protein
VYNKFVMQSNRLGDDTLRMTIDRAIALELAAAVLTDGYLGFQVVEVHGAGSLRRLGH